MNVKKADIFLYVIYNKINRNLNKSVFYFSKNDHEEAKAGPAREFSFDE